MSMMCHPELRPKPKGLTPRNILAGISVTKYWAPYVGQARRVIGFTLARLPALIVPDKLAGSSGRSFDARIAWNASGH